MVRRIVTGHVADGSSVIVSDEAAPMVRTLPEGVTFHEIWSTGHLPVALAPVEQDPTHRRLRVPPDKGGVLLRVTTMPPGTSSPMHRTATVDFAIVLSGEVVAVVGDDETTVRQGEILVQRGTDHLWANRSDTDAVIAFVLLDAAFAAELQEVLPRHATERLMEDPMSSAP